MIRCRISWRTNSGTIRGPDEGTNQKNYPGSERLRIIRITQDQMLDLIEDLQGDHKADQEVQIGDQEDQQGDHKGDREDQKVGQQGDHKEDKQGDHKGTTRGTTDQINWILIHFLTSFL